MVGFALIIIIVAIILLVFLSIYLRNQSTTVVQSFEIQNFILSFLQYTTDCQNNLEFLPINKLISDCYIDNNMVCENGQNACEVLKSSVKDIMDKSWNTNEGSMYKGYYLNIVINNESSMLNISKGQTTANYKESMQDFSNYRVYFRVYE